MDTDALKDRFKQFALDAVLFCEQLPEKGIYKVINNQMMRSSTSSASNYRAACRRKSTRDFIAKLGIVEEELDETLFWLEFTVKYDDKWRSSVAPIWKEGNELLSITIASIKTSRFNQAKNKDTPKSKKA